MRVAKKKWLEAPAMRETNFCVPPSLDRIAEDSMYARCLPVTNGEALGLAIRSIQPVVDGCLVQRHHQALVRNGAVRLLEKVPRRVETVRREVLVRCRCIEIWILSQSGPRVLEQKHRTSPKSKLGAFRHGAKHEEPRRCCKRRAWIRWPRARCARTRARRTPSARSASIPESRPLRLRSRRTPQ